MSTIPAPLFFRWLLLASLILAGPRALAAPLAWDLPAQPAADALMAFSDRSGYQVLYSAKELAGVRSGAVLGEHEPAEALRRLLAGTNFEAVNTGEKRVVVRARVLSRVGGLVLAGKDGPLAGATATIPELNLSAVTGRTGRYQFSRVPSGTYTVVFRYEGWPAVRLIGIAVEPGSAVELQPVILSAQEAPREMPAGQGVLSTEPRLQLEHMIVTPSRFGVGESPSASVATLTHRELEAMPQLGEDLYRAISRLPGLAALDLSAKFWVRGAPNEQLLARLDGATLLEPFHMKDLDGALSIIDLETVARLDLTSGGFSSEYGDRLAGVLLMETETPWQAKPRTTLGLSLTGARATNRGWFAGGRGSWLVTGRMGYPDIALEQADDGGGDFKPRYHDVFAKVEFQPRPGHTLAVHALHSKDTLETNTYGAEDVRSQYGSDYFWARWRAAFSDRLTAETVLSHAELGWRVQGAGNIDDYLPFEVNDDRRLRLAELRQDWSATLTDRALFRTGFELRDGAARYRYHRLRSLFLVRDGELLIEPRVLDRNLDPEGFSAGAYTALRLQPARRLVVEPGVRFDRNDFGGGADWTPRFNAAYDFGRAKARLAWGRYRQEQGLHELNVKDGESGFHPAELAEHRVVGLEAPLGPRLNVRAELYQRITGHPRPHGENPFNVSEPMGELLSDRVFLRPTQAQARGFELILESRGGGPVTWAANYVLSRTEETLDGRTVPRERDQRHAFQANVGWRPNARWQLTAAWQYHTGWATTGVVFTDFLLNDGRIATRRTAGPLYGERLPAYHRLDLRVTRIYPLKHGTLRVFLDVFNAYDQKNTLSYEYSPAPGGGTGLGVARGSEELFPLLPTLGFIWDF